MGIRGLTTYISQNSDRFHEPLKLQDCFLVVDGNSIASKLYIDVCKSDSTFGGDYDKYVKTVHDFFALLFKCNITPLVVLDGGYEVRKLKTVEKRFKAKILACDAVTHSKGSVFPLLMKEAFKQAMKDISVKYAQADFEADNEVAVLSKYMKCPVLSYDSDFYVYDVMYIPFSTLDLHITKVKNNNGCMQKYLKCKVFRAESFIKYFGGLDKSLLPLLGTLLGNDYVPISLFEKFYGNVKLPKNKKMTVQQRRISAVFEWLRKESLDSAVKKIGDHFKKAVRKDVIDEINDSIAGYCQCVSGLLPHFNLNHETMATAAVEMNKVEETCFRDEGTEVSISFDTDDSNIWRDEVGVTSLSSIDGERIQAVPLLKFSEAPVWPKWVVELYRTGDLPAFLSDMYYLHIFFCQPQVEDFSLQDSHSISFPILRVSYSLLVSDNFKESPVTQKHFNRKSSLTCFTRCGTKVHQIELNPVKSLPCLSSFPSLSSLPSVPVDVRRKVVFDALGLNKDDIEILLYFPSKWILFAAVIVFWGRNSNVPEVNICHLHAVLISLLIVGVVDCSLDCGGDMAIISSKHINKEKGNEGIQSSSSADVGMQSAENLYDKEFEPKSLKEALSQVNRNDCQMVAEKLLQFCDKELNQVRTHKQCNKHVLHLFAQLQTCLQQGMALNSLLSCPIQQAKISCLFSGSLVFSAFLNLDRIANVEDYMVSLLKESYTVAYLYKALTYVFKILLPSLSVPQRKVKRKKIKGNRKSITSYSDDSDVSDNHVTLFDINNKFSILKSLNS